MKQKEKRLRQELKVQDGHTYLNYPKVKGSQKIDNLTNLQDEIKALENTITNNLWAILAKHASSIHHSLEVIARLDTIFARAFYARERGGIIPFMGEDGVVQVDNFIHPILSDLGRRDSTVSSTVVPIQLLLPRKSPTQTALVITGSNGKTHHPI